MTRRRAFESRPPGCGKTAFARALLAGLALPHELYSCGGVADASLGGTSRRGATGEPALPVALVPRHRLASPAVILDELEKTGTSRHNGNLLDALLGRLEPASAQGWHDPYIEAAVDVSHLVWIATANTLDPVPPPRCATGCASFTSPSPARTISTSWRAVLARALAWRLDPPPARPRRSPGCHPRAARPRPVAAHGWLVVTSQLAGAGGIRPRRCPPVMIAHGACE